MPVEKIPNDGTTDAVCLRVGLFRVQYTEVLADPTVRASDYHIMEGIHLSLGARFRNAQPLRAVYALLPKSL